MVFRNGLIWLWAVVIGVCLAVEARAQSWETHQLGEAAFQVPANWQMTHRITDTELDFASPDGKYRLAVFWWLPDEPLLGFDDIVRHQDVRLAGRDALFIQSRFPEHTLLQIAFKEPRASGEQLLMNLEIVGDVDGGFYNDLISRIAFPAPVAPQPPVPQPVAPRTRAIEDAPLGAETVEHAAGFSVRLPTDWQPYRSEAPGLHHFMALSQDRLRLLMITSSEADAGRNALEVLETFETALYEQSLVPQSIDHDSEAQFDGIAGKTMQIVARIFNIGGLRMPYDKGRIDLFRGGSTERAFWIAVIRPLDTADAQETVLRQIAGSFNQVRPPAPTVAPPVFGSPEQVAVPPVAPTPPVAAVPPEPVPPVAQPPQEVAPPSDPASFLATLKNRIQALADGASPQPTIEANTADTATAPQAPPGPANDATATLFPAEDTFWRPHADEGGNFETFARLDSAALVVDVPEGNSWGQTGLTSTQPVFHIPAHAATEAARLRLTVDPQSSMNYALALSPAERVNEGIWHGHDLFLTVGQPPDKGPVLSAIVQMKKVASVALDATKPLSILELTMEPDGAFVVRDQDGTYLLEGNLGQEFSREGWHLVVLGNAAVRNGSAKLHLTSITKDRVPRRQGNDERLWLTEPQDVVLFDGQSLGPRWHSFEHAGGSYAEMASLKEGTLHVAIPEGRGHAHVGIRTTDAVIWPDKFSGDARIDLDFAFNPARTDDFTIALSALYGLDGNAPSDPKFLLHWRKTPEGIKATTLRNYDKDRRDTDALAAMPDTVRLTLTPEGVQVVAEGLSDDVIPWPDLTSGQGFRIYVYSHASTKNAASGMELKSIRMHRVPGKEFAAPVLAPGVDPLPRVTLFAGEPTDLWLPASVNGATFEEHSRFEDGKLIADIPEKKFLWGKTGLLSAEPVVILDDRVDTTPYEIRLSVDPRETTGMQVLVSSRKVEDMWESSVVAFGFIQQSDSQIGGDYVLSLSHGPYKSWSRRIDRDWIENDWNGTLILRFSDGWVEIEAEGGPKLHGGALPMGKGYKLYMTVYAHPDSSRGAGHMVLKRIEGGWMTPQMLSAATARTLAGDDEFDADAFLDDLATELDGE